MDINEHLALNLMGWTKHPDERYPTNPETYKDKDGDYKFMDFCWDPRKNMEQAFMCLDKFEWWRIDRSSQRYYVSIYQDRGFDIKEKSLSKAISLACAKATGWEDE